MELASNKKWRAEVPLHTPYRRAAQEWDTRMGNAVIHAKNWRIAAFICMANTLLSIAGLIFLGAQPKLVPHIVQVDKLGEARYVGPVGRAFSQFVPSEATIQFQLRRFIADTRELSSDPLVIKRQWMDAYNMATPAAANMLTAYVQNNDPFHRATEERVTIEVTSMVALTKETWQADWVESSYSKNGTLIGTRMWRGTFRTSLRAGPTEEQLAKNPLGLYVEEFHWSRLNGS